LKDTNHAEGSDMSCRGGTLLRYGLSLVLGLTLFAGCAQPPVREQAAPPPQPAPSSTRVYVANESSNTVSVIDGVNFQPLATVDARNHATHDLALSRDGKRLFATNLASGRLSVIDTETMETIASIPTGARCHVVTLTNDNRHAWVANIGDDNISIVDTATFRILGTIPVGKGPTGLAFSRDGRFAYVSNQGDRTISVIDTASHQVIKTIPVGNNPHFLVLGPDGRIWGTNTGDNDIYVIDPSNHEKLASITVGPNPQQIAFAYKGIAGPNAYVTVGELNQVIVVGGDAKNPRIAEAIPVGQRPNGIWANPEGTRLFVVHEASNDLYVIDTGTSAVLAAVPVGRKPIRVVVSR
jgi:YVTN family beta-propeller protein